MYLVHNHCVEDHINRHVSIGWDLAAKHMIAKLRHRGGEDGGFPIVCAVNSILLAKMVSFHTKGEKWLASDSIIETTDHIHQNIGSHVHT